jgi:DNA-binding protein H-NS
MGRQPSAVARNTIYNSTNQWISLGMKLRIDNMSADELWSLHEEIGKILSDRISSEKRELERRNDDGSRAPRRKYPEVIPKYRNPKAPHETWAGRGKQPRWMVAALAAGSKMEDFLIIAEPSEKRSDRNRHKSK